MIFKHLLKSGQKFDLIKYIIIITLYWFLPIWTKMSDSLLVTDAIETFFQKTVSAFQLVDSLVSVSH